MSTEGVPGVSWRKWGFHRTLPPGWNPGSWRRWGGRAPQAEPRQEASHSSGGLHAGQCFNELRKQRINKRKLFPYIVPLYHPALFFIFVLHFKKSLLAQPPLGGWHSLLVLEIIRGCYITLAWVTLRQGVRSCLVQAGPWGAGQAGASVLVTGSNLPLRGFCGLQFLNLEKRRG